MMHPSSRLDIKRKGSIVEFRWIDAHTGRNIQIRKIEWSWIELVSEGGEISINFSEENIDAT